MSDADDLIARLRAPETSLLDRIQTIQDLGQAVSSPLVVAALVDVLEGDSSSLQQYCAEALGDLGCTDARKALEKAAASDSYLVSYTAKRALEKLGNSVADEAPTPVVAGTAAQEHQEEPEADPEFAVSSMLLEPQEEPEANPESTVSMTLLEPQEEPEPDPESTVSMTLLEPQEEPEPDPESTVSMTLLELQAANEVKADAPEPAPPPVPATAPAPAPPPVPATAPAPAPPPVKADAPDDDGTRKGLGPLLAEALADSDYAYEWNPSSRRQKVVVSLRSGRKQTVHVMVSGKTKGNLAMLTVYTVCGPADPARYEWALESNLQRGFGALAIASGGGEGKLFVLVSTTMMEATMPIELRRTISSLARHGDELEKELTGQDVL